MDSFAVHAFRNSLSTQQSTAASLVTTVGPSTLKTPSEAPTAAPKSTRIAEPQDKLSISQESLDRLAAEKGGEKPGAHGPGHGPVAPTDAEPTDLEGTHGGGESDDASSSANPLNLSDTEKDQVRELQARDSEVRAHENAHAAVGGQFAGSPSYTYTQGPDGRQYATGGEVPIRLEQGSTPTETIRNAQQVRRAALAPAEPSGADRSVAAAASSMEAEARRELAAERLETQQGENGEEAFATTGVATATSVDAPSGTANPESVRDAGGSVFLRANDGLQYPGQTEPQRLDVFA